MTTFKRKLIGKGAFTKAYQIEENLVEVVTVCPAKECYAIFSQGTRFAPTIEKIDCRDDGKQVYHMPLYPKMRAPSKQLNAESFAIYKALRSITSNWGSNYNYSPSYNSFCDAVRGLPISDDAKEAITSLAGDVCNAIDCYDMRFEISPRNVTCDSDGNLVMLDCFFCIKTLSETNSRRFGR